MIITNVAWTPNQRIRMMFEESFYMYAFSRRFYPKQLTVHSGYTLLYHYVCSLGIKPTTFCAANAMLYRWGTETRHVTLKTGVN